MPQTRLELEQELEEELSGLAILEEKFLRQKLYRENLFELCHLMGFNDLGKAHQKLCNEMERTRDLYRRRLFLFFRGFFKTSVITQADTVQEIIRNPNIRILLVSSTLENAKMSLRIVKNTFWTNNDFREVFPEFCPPENTKEFGSQLTFSVPNMKRLGREGTVECASVGQTLTGRHYDLIKLSDLVTDKNINTKATMKSTSDWVAYALSLLNNPARNRVDIEGTPYDYNDFHMETLGKAKKEKDTYFVLKGPIHTKGVPLFPERFTMDDVGKIEKDQGSAVFAGQYLLEPINEGTAIFKKSQIIYMDRVNLPRIVPSREFMYPRYMTIDLAVSEDSHADYSCMTVSMFDVDNIEYVIDMQYGHWGIREIGERLLKLYKQYEPESIGVESVAFQKLLFFIFDEMYRNEKTLLPFVELKRDTRRTKVMRIKGLQPRFEQHKIRFCDDLDRVFIENQLLRFDPDKNTNADDFLDCLADMDVIKSIPDKEVVNPYKLHPNLRWIEWLNTPKDERSEDDFAMTEEEVTEREYYANAGRGFN